MIFYKIIEKNDNHFLLALDYQKVLAKKKMKNRIKANHNLQLNKNVSNMLKAKYPCQMRHHHLQKYKIIIFIDYEHLGLILCKYRNTVMTDTKEQESCKQL